MKRVCFGLVAWLLAGLGQAQAQISDGVVRIGVLNDLSGVFQDTNGPGSVVAARLAAEDFAGGGRGIRVEVVQADHQNRADVGSAIARRWLDQEGVDAIVDVPNSAVGLAVNTVARGTRMTFLASSTATSDLTGRACSPNTVQWVTDSYAIGRTAARAMLQRGGDTWYFLTVDYALGQSIQRDATEFIQANGGRVLGASRHPLGATDFSSYLLAAQASGAKVLGIANAGNDTANTLKQAAEFGLTRRGMRLVGLVMVITNIHALGLEATQGLHFTETFYWDLNDRTRALSQRLAPKVGGARMTMLQAGTYGGTLHLLKAYADLAPEARASGRAVVERMKAMPTDDDAFGPGRIREDGRKLHPAYLLRVKAPAESRGPWDYCTVAATTPAEEAFRPLAQGGCPLVRA